MYLHSVNAYADKILDELDASSTQALRSMAMGELPKLHHSWGRAIRNEFGLWEPDHPLTKHWHEKEDERDIQDGIDMSVDHPDHVSMLIMEQVWRKVNA